MKLSQTSLALLEESVKKAIGRYNCGGEQTIVTDIHLQPKQASGDFTIFNDEDEKLAHAYIEEWTAYEGDDFYESLEQDLTSLLNKLKNAAAFDKLNIMKPYSFVLVDEEKETIADLLLMDDDTLMVNDGLLKGLDEELDTFLKDLLEK